MKKMYVVAVAILFVFALCSKVRAETIWSDGFESGDFSAWTSVSGSWGLVHSSSGAKSGAYRASIDGETSLDGDILLLEKSTVGYENLQWSCWYKVNAGLEEEDHVFVEWSNNSGADWQILTEYTKVPSGDWQYASFDLPETADDNPLCQFRFRAVLGNPSDCMSFDDMSLLTVPEPSSILLLLSCLFFLIMGYKLK